MISLLELGKYSFFHFDICIISNSTTKVSSCCSIKLEGCTFDFFHHVLPISLIMFPAHLWRNGPLNRGRVQEEEKIYLYLQQQVGKKQCFTFLQSSSPFLHLLFLLIDACNKMSAFIHGRQHRKIWAEKALHSWITPT